VDFWLFFTLVLSKCIARTTYAWKLFVFYKLCNYLVVFDVSGDSAVSLKLYFSFCVSLQMNFSFVRVPETWNWHSMLGGIDHFVLKKKNNLTALSYA